ncbi:maleylpyruvate isomerase family mycothiol-dependent enzyme [Fodinicola feengrottensis]|uniref:Maleylpyruvate isomerase family mycothiol-dependent enzyme n=1 Tax=Fodinicola feengrottensis TaxID=435914 RepID=A0ABN2HWA2_9ACTN
MHLSEIRARSTALRQAVAAAPDLQARVPGCPDWSLRNLVDHLGQVQRFWAVVVQQGTSDRRPTEDAVDRREPHGDLVEWSAESTELLVAALSTAEPDQPCWSWWPAEAAPLTAGAIARHQVVEAAVHAYDAQETIGKPEPIPDAVDLVAEFLEVSYGSAGEWPHEPTRVAVRTTQGPSWQVGLTATGSAITTDDHESAKMTLSGSASDLLLALHLRIPADRLKVEGDGQVVRDLLAWPSL